MRKRYLMGKCGIAESHRLAEEGDVLRPGVLEAAAAEAARRADELVAAKVAEAAAAAAAKEAEAEGEEIDLDANEEEQNVVEDEDMLDDIDLMDDIDELLDDMVGGEDDDDSGINSVDMDGVSSSASTELFVRTPPSDKLVLSAALMCAVRVSVMNETDVDLLCPRARGAWDDHKCEDEIFTEYQPVDEDNERGMIAALRSSVQVCVRPYWFWKVGVEHFQV